MSKYKYSYNENYFNNIDSKEKSYWLGFIMADGYILDNRSKIKHNTALRIRLCHTDKHHLEKLNESMSCNKPIKIVKNYGIYQNCKDLAEFCLQNKKIVEDLKNIGFISGNKSCHEFIPSCIKSNKEFIKSFILGIFDGDGSISITNKTKEFSIVSSKEVCNFIKDFLEETLNIKLNKISANGCGKDLFRVRTCSSKNIKLIKEFIYKDENIYLERKYESFNKI